MYYSKTENMTVAENKLFAIKVPSENSHTKSNVPAERGYVYVIVGTRATADSGSRTWCIIL